MKKNWVGKVIGGLLLISGIIILAYPIAPYVPKLADFDQTFYPAVRYFSTGQNPYQADYVEVSGGVPASFFNPAWTLLILAPFGLFSLEVARALWIFFLVGITFAAIYQLKQWGMHAVWYMLLAALPWSLIGVFFWANDGFASFWSGVGGQFDLFFPTNAWQWA